MAILTIFNFSWREFFNIVQANERAEVKIHGFYIRHLVWYALSPRSTIYVVLIIQNAGLNYKKRQDKKVQGCTSTTPVEGQLWQL